MLKKLIRFDDLEGNPVEKEYHFHLSVAEITEWAAEGTNPGEELGDQIKRIAEKGAPGELLATFKRLIETAVGEKDADGITFRKDPFITQSFMQTEAYSALLIELISNANAAADFVTGIMPAKFQEKMRALAASTDLEQAEVRVPVIGGEPIVMKPKKLGEYTTKELEELPYDQFQKLLKANKGSLSREVLLLAFERQQLQ